MHVVSIPMLYNSVILINSFTHFAVHWSAVQKGCATKLAHFECAALVYIKICTYVQSTCPLFKSVVWCWYLFIGNTYRIMQYVCGCREFGTWTVVSVKGTLVEAKLCTFTLESKHFIFKKCPSYIHDGASAKFSTNWDETDYSATRCKYMAQEILLVDDGNDDISVGSELSTLHKVKIIRHRHLSCSYPSVLFINKALWHTFFWIWTSWVRWQPDAYNNSCLAPSNFKKLTPNSQFFLDLGFFFQKPMSPHKIQEGGCKDIQV